LLPGLRCWLWIVRIVRIWIVGVSFSFRLVWIVWIIWIARFWIVGVSFSVRLVWIVWIIWIARFWIVGVSFSVRFVWIVWIARLYIVGVSVRFHLYRVSLCRYHHHRCARTEQEASIHHRKSNRHHLPVEVG